MRNRTHTHTHSDVQLPPVSAVSESDYLDCKPQIKRLMMSILWNTQEPVCSAGRGEIKHYKMSPQHVTNTLVSCIISFHSLHEPVHPSHFAELHRLKCFSVCESMMRRRESGDVTAGEKTEINLALARFRLTMVL